MRRFLQYLSPTSSFLMLGLFYGTRPTFNDNTLTVDIGWDLGSSRMQASGVPTKFGPTLIHVVINNRVCVREMCHY